MESPGVNKSQPQQQKVENDPSDILSKINNSNNDFISAYNSFAMGNR